MKMKNKLSQLISVFILAATFAGFSCNKSDDTPVNEEELITTLRVSLTDVVTSEVKVFEFSDPDGTGGNPPTKNDQIVIGAGKTYTCSLEVFDQSKNPAVNITPEIVREGVDHQFYYEPVGISVLVQNLNKDLRGFPLGNTSTWVAAVATTGTMKITLKHKPGSIKVDGDPVTIGETDIEVTFQAKVE